MISASTAAVSAGTAGGFAVTIAGHLLFGGGVPDEAAAAATVAPAAAEASCDPACDGDDSALAERLLAELRAFPTERLVADGAALAARLADGVEALADEARSFPSARALELAPWLDGVPPAVAAAAAASLAALALVGAAAAARGAWRAARPRPWFKLDDTRDGGQLRVLARAEDGGSRITALERRLCCTWRRTTAVARLHEYVRSELAAAPNVHTAVLVLE